MSISKQDVIHVAKLSRLELLDDELDNYTKHLNSILNFANKLNELDTENIKPSSHALDINNAFREDVEKESISNELALANAPDKKDGQFKVPLVMER